MAAFAVGKKGANSRFGLVSRHIDDLNAKISRGKLYFLGFGIPFAPRDYHLGFNIRNGGDECGRIVENVNKNRRLQFFADNGDED